MRLYAECDSTACSCIEPCAGWCGAEIPEHHDPEYLARLDELDREWAATPTVDDGAPWPEGPLGF